VLAWHSQQNRTYLRNYTGLTAPAVIELLTNSGFESGLTGWSTFNTGNPAGTSTVTSTTAAAEVRTGTTAMKVVNPIGYPGSQWRVQVSSGAFTTVPGKQYAISYWVKATSSGGSIRLSTGPSAAQYQGDQNIGTAWQQVTWTITASLTSTTFLFDLGQAANTYFIDDASVKEVVNAPSGASVMLKVDTALNTYITNMVTRYKNKVRAWDVINEMFTEGGEIRNESNSPDPNWFVWSHYLGRDFGVKAFNYAKAADPTADLFINDYNLETSSAKLDSLIKYVAEIRAKGAKVDGIGTQMHINWNTSMVGIEEMFRKLGATGLKVRITELDIATLLGGNAKSPTPQLLAYQAQMAKNVVESYLRNVPKAQRAGITIWGLHDSSSWRYNNGAEFALFYNSDFTKKPAYSAFLQALRGK
jgi:endo-1,4-beta-xylanase